MTLSQLAQQLYDVLVSAYALTPEEATECVRTAEFSLLKDVSIRLPLPKPGVHAVAPVKGGRNETVVGAPLVVREGQVGLVYALCDPDTSEIRYVGKTTGSLANRLRGHLRITSSRSRTYCQRWIQSLPQAPIIEEIDAADTIDELNDAERYWIWWYRHVLGARLTNLTEGGDGGDTSGAFTEETKRKISKRHKGRPLTEAHREAIRAGQLRRPLEERRRQGQRGMAIRWGNR